VKTKLYKIIGVALTLVLLASLTVGLAGVPAGAASSNLKFIKLELPKVENYGTGYTSYSSTILDGEFANSEGDFWATPGIDLGPIAQTPDGGILFAAVSDGPYGSNAWYHLLKSTDGGYSWTVTNFWRDSGVADDEIVDIVTSPEYSDDTTLAVATEDYVYISDDGGKNFTQLAQEWSDDISDLDVTIAEDGDLALMVSSYDGDVYVAKGLLAWTAQLIPGAISDYALACSFLPTFADDGDIGLCALVTYDGSGPVTDPDTTTMTFSFANVRDGGEWGDDIADAPFTNAEGIPFESDWGRIAFPDDFDAFGIGNNVCFAGIVEAGALGVTTLGSDDGSDAYRVICKEAGTSTAVDLDVRGVITTLLPTATAITSVDVCGDAEAASILVGTDAINLGDTPAYFSAYMSEDSGDTWAPSMKCPTGGTGAAIEFSDVMTRVLMAPDFCDDGLAYASTKGAGTSAFQRTTDGAESWNQISIIDYGDGTTGYAITATGFSAFGYNAEDTLYMITQVSGDFGALWGRIDGSHWERILSYANPGVTDQLSQLNILGDGSAMFATDLNVGEIWRSSDMGATWPKKISAKTPLTTVTPVSLTTIFTGSVGEIWWTERSGTGWEKPDDSEIPGGAAVIVISVAGGLVIISTDAGNGFISSDGGETVEKIGSDNPFAGGPTVVLADLGFDANGILYAVSPGSADVMRCEVDLNDPGDAEWVQIDNNQGTTVEYDETLFIAGGPPLSLPPSGILYIVDAAPVNTDTDPDFYAGGLWRSTNPTADTDSVVPPYFERENKGLDDGDALGFLNLDMDSNLAPTFFCQNPAAANYWDQVVMFTDILNVGVPLASPAADETGVGLLPEDEVYPKVNLLWEEMAGATSYQYQVAIDADFKTKVAVGFTDSLATPTMDLQPNTTYYWRARVADEGSLIGAPLISPWSEVRKFKTAIGASMARPDLQAPWPGEPDVPLSPTFEWSGIEWAEVYEYELAIDPMTTAGGYFSEPLVALVGTSSLVSTAWKCDIALDYETRYYWHVKAIGVDTDTPWSDVGTFTTMGVPPEIPPPSDGITIPPVQQITPAWIWAIVIIGAILVIAVVVLIVTTRRVP